MSGHDHSSGRLLAVVNPAAGGGSCGRKAASVLEELRKAGLEIETRETSSPGGAREIARGGFAEGFRHFIAVGGDGTSFEVLNGFLLDSLTTGERASLGFLPLGTGNSFLRDFSSQAVEYSTRALVHGEKRPCDVLHLTHDSGTVYALGIVSFGFPAAVASLVNRRFKRFGELGYSLGVIGTLARLQTITLPYREDDGGLLDKPLTFLCISNNRYVGGGMLMAPQADIADGLADVIRVDPVSRLELIRTFPKIFTGAHLQHPAVRTSRARRVDFELTEAIDIMVDGEVVQALPRRLEVVANALDVRV